MMSSARKRSTFSKLEPALVSAALNLAEKLTAPTEERSMTSEETMASRAVPALMVVVLARKSLFHGVSLVTDLRLEGVPKSVWPMMNSMGELMRKDWVASG